MMYRFFTIFSRQFAYCTLYPVLISLKFTRTGIYVFKKSNVMVYSITYNMLSEKPIPHFSIL
jgi:hypothetical protein